MNFKCRKEEGHKFSVEKPQDIDGIWHWRGVVHCPYCGTADLEEVLNVTITSTQNLEGMRRENRERTAEARTQATRAQAEQRRLNPDVVLSPIDKPGNRSPFGQGPVSVPKSVVESLNEKGSRYNDPE
jgi:hypothetical protein